MTSLRGLDIGYDWPRSLSTNGVALATSYLFLGGRSELALWRPLGSGTRGIDVHDLHEPAGSGRGEGSMAPMTQALSAPWARLPEGMMSAVGRANQASARV